MALVQDKELNQFQICAKWKGKEKKTKQTKKLNTYYQDVTFKIKIRTV